MPTFFKKFRYILSRLLIISGIVYGLIFTLPLVTFAAGSFNFGGQVLMNHFCTCSENFWLLIGPPRPALLSFTIFQPQFANYMLPETGVWALGTYTPGGVCLDQVAYYCVEFFPSEGTVNLVGTSLPF